MKLDKEYILNLFDLESKKSNYSWYTYQPINCDGYEITHEQSGRKCSDRSNAIMYHIKNNIVDYNKKTYVDWGCNLGYFVFDLMKNGCFAIGIDKNKKYIDVCNFIKNQYDDKYKKPNFFIDELSKDSLQSYRADVGLCFSVLHHLKKHKFSIMSEFAKYYKQSYIEMDGNDYGYDFLKTFYWDLDLVVEVSDKYGSGVRKRKTWFCNNITKNYEYENIKLTNLLSGRGAFKKIDTKTGQKTFVKRERSGLEHTWIKTDIGYESSFYRKYKSIFFPEFISYTMNDKEKILELEFIDKDSYKGDSLENIFKWIEDNNLYIIDLSPSQFIKTANGFVLTDLESIVDKSDIENKLKKTVEIKSLQSQLRYIERELVR